MDDSALADAMRLAVARMRVSGMPIADLQRYIDLADAGLPQNLARRRHGQHVLSRVDGRQGEAVIDSLADVSPEPQLKVHIGAALNATFVAREVFQSGERQDVPQAPGQLRLSELDAPFHRPGRVHSLTGQRQFPCALGAEQHRRAD